MFIICGVFCASYFPSSFFKVIYGFFKPINLILEGKGKLQSIVEKKWQLLSILVWFSDFISPWTEGAAGGLHSPMLGHEKWDCD